MRVLANDFGPHHGFTLWEDGNLQSWEIEFGQEGHREFYRTLDYLVTPGTIFIGERFLHLHEFADRAKIDLTAPEYIGVAKTWLQGAGHKDVIWQNASQACGATAFWGDNKKGEGGNQKIKKLGLWQPGKRHAMDSLRHFLFWFSFTHDNAYYLERLK